MAIQSRVVALWLLVLVNLIWGVGFVVVDDAIKNIPVYSFNAFRFGIAALALLPLLFLSQRKDKKKAAKNPETQINEEASIVDLMKIGFGLGLFLFLGFSLQTQGLLYTTVSNTGFITGLCVPLVPVIGFFLYKRKVGKQVWFSVLTATCGLYMLTVKDSLTLNFGDVLVALCAICYAVHIVLMSRVSNGFSVLKLSIVQLASVAIYSAIAAVIEQVISPQENAIPLLDSLRNFNVIAGILYSGILASAFAYWVQTSSQRLLEAHQVALIFALEPIFGHIAAFIILGEELGVQGWLGACLIIAGMLYAELGGKKVKMQPLDQMAAPSE